VRKLLVLVTIQSSLAACNRDLDYSTENPPPQNYAGGILTVDVYHRSLLATISGRYPAEKKQGKRSVGGQEEGCGQVGAVGLDGARQVVQHPHSPLAARLAHG
jgi:hypothetical protein